MQSYQERDEEDVKVAVPATDDKVQTDRDDSSSVQVTETPILFKSNEYPPIDWSSWAAFKASMIVRLKAVFTKRFIGCIIWGQVLSLCITTTNTCTTELSIHNWQLPTTQSFFVYFFLCLIYTPYTIYSYGFKSWCRMIYTDGWRYLILACVDVEANYVVVKAYQYSDITSLSLLNCLATPSCMVVTYFLVKARYHWTQIAGALVAIAGLALLVVSDVIVNGRTEGSDKPKGDGLMILGAFLYGLSNGLEEYFVRGRPLYEVVGQLGFWGSIVNGIQSAGLEHSEWVHQATWSGRNIGYLVGFISAMILLYTTAPLLFRASSSPFYNLSLLTSNFFSLLIGIGLFNASPYWLYFVAFPIVIGGLILYFSCTSPAHQTGKKFIVKGRGKRAEQTGAVLVEP